MLSNSVCSNTPKGYLFIAESNHLLRSDLTYMKTPQQAVSVDSGLCCIMQSRFIASRDNCGQRANVVRQSISFPAAKLTHAALHVFHDSAIYASRKLG